MKKRSYSVPALEKGLSVIETLSRSAVPLGVTDLYEANPLPKTTIFMILNTLEDLNYVRKTEDGKYRLTMKLYNIGKDMLSRLDIRSVAKPVMERLASELRFTVHLAVLEKGKAVYIEKVKGPGFVQFSTEIGQSMHLHNSGVGKALAAFVPEEALDRHLSAHGLPAATPNTITDPNAFKSFLAFVRETGYAIEDEEGEIGIRCIAAPIFDHAGATVAALGVTALRNELPSVSFQEIGGILKQCALQISQELGYERNG